MTLSHHGGEMGRKRSIPGARGLLHTIKKAHVPAPIYGKRAVCAIKRNTESALLESCGTSQAVFGDWPQQQKQLLALVIIRGGLAAVDVPNVLPEDQGFLRLSLINFGHVQGDNLRHQIAQLGMRLDAAGQHKAVDDAIGFIDELIERTGQRSCTRLRVGGRCGEKAQNSAQSD